MSTSSAQQLVLDLRQVCCNDSAGTGVCVKLLRSAHDLQRTAKIDPRAPAVVRGLAMMGLMRAFDVRASAE